MDVLQLEKLEVWLQLISIVGFITLKTRLFQAQFDSKIIKRLCNNYVHVLDD